MPMTFEEAYEKLNSAQRKAVDTIEGPVMVIAGPGTGKTQILTLRIANILKKTDAAAESILALTFTESAAANMRKRLVSLIGSRGYYVTIGTFHGFANRLIQEYPEYFEEILGGQNASEVEQIGIIRQLIDEGGFEHLSPFGEKYFYVRDILSAIRDLKREGVGPKRFEEMVKEAREEFDLIPGKIHEKGPHKGKMKGEYQKREKDIRKNIELVRLYRGYQELLRKKRLYDFEDMILEAVRALGSKEEFLLQVQEKYQYILVDEHQDTNGAQNRVLELLASFHENPNLFVVGDEKQAIFRFQGASLENFLYFKKKYPGVELVNLEENYRSTQHILDSAQSVIDENRAAIKSPLRSQKKTGHPIEIISFATAGGELVFLADSIEQMLKDGVPASEIAVLYRENRDVFPIADILEKRGVPFVIESDRNILDDPNIRKLLALFLAIDAYGNDEKLISALHIDFLGVDPLDIYKLVERRETRNVSIYKVIRAKDRLRAFDLEHPEKILELGEKLKEWHVKSRNVPFLHLFEEIIRESGFLAHLLASPGYLEHMEKVSALFDEVRKMVGNKGDFSLRDFIAHLEILRAHGVMLRTKITRRTEAVRLMTAHKAKGLEFDRVFITGVYDGHWGNKRSVNRFDLPFKRSVDVSALEKNEDERRIFYMAITRARESVHISWSAHGPDGRERVPSQFLAEIKGELKTERPGEEFDRKHAEKPEALFAPRAYVPPTVQDLAFLKELFLRRGMSATALNNYLECPWKYFYQNLVRIPKLQTRHQIYGSAVHKALEAFFNEKKARPETGKSFLLDQFRSCVAKQPLQEREREAVLDKGEKILPKYYAHYASSWNYDTKTEVKIQANFGEDVILTGNLDKLEFTKSAGGRTGDVIVVDYKTGAPKTRGWIEGKTQDSNGNYKRQLVFYRLLLDMHPESKLRMSAGAIDFVEPDQKGAFHKEVFEISDGEVEELKAVIRKTADEILSLKFWNGRCGEKECEFCALRDLFSASGHVVHN